MNGRAGVFAWGLAGFLLLFFASFYIVRGGIINIGLSMVLIAPFVFIIFINLRKIWHVLVLIFLTMNDLTFPLYGLSKLSPILLLLGASSLILILDGTIKHSRRIINFTLADKLIAAVSFIMTLRLLHDRPGFVALGMGQGGLIRALTYTSATWFYFAVRIFVAQARFTRKQLVYAAGAVAIVCVITLYNGSKTGVFIARFLAGDPFWMICALLISLLATATSIQKRNLLFYAASLLFILMGIVSQFRSRVFFFAAEIFSVAYFMGRFRRTFIIVGICGTIGMVGLVAATGKIPTAMSRVFSLFVEVEMVELTAEGSTGAYGWEDRGRGELYAAAWEEIVQHPLLGKGLGLNVSEALTVLATTRRAAVEMLIMAGSYHNSIVALAVKCGVPAAFLISWALLNIISKFIRWVRNLDNGVIKTWGMVLVAFWFSNTFMMLMNGGSNEFFSELVISGFMMGMMNHPQLSNPEALKPSTKSAKNGNDAAFVNDDIGVI